MGSNITTFVDTLLAALLLNNPPAFTVVLVEMVSIALVSVFVLALIYRLEVTALQEEREEVLPILGERGRLATARRSGGADGSGHARGGAIRRGPGATETTTGRTWRPEYTMAWSSKKSWKKRAAVIMIWSSSAPTRQSSGNDSCWTTWSRRLWTLPIALCLWFDSAVLCHRPGWIVE